MTRSVAPLSSVDDVVLDAAVLGAGPGSDVPGRSVTLGVLAGIVSRELDRFEGRSGAAVDVWGLCDRLNAALRFGDLKVDGLVVAELAGRMLWDLCTYPDGSRSKMTAEDASWLLAQARDAALFPLELGVLRLLGAGMSVAEVDDLLGE